MMDSTALMALVEWWRPETHTFHLLCGEVTVTLQDIAMILSLPIDAALAWLYHALCDGCSRTGPNANLRGCAYLLQV
jgi:hypothetical protein